MIEKSSKKENSIMKKVDDFANSLFASKIILGIGFFLRGIAFAIADPSINQHDVTEKKGHFDYAMYLFRHAKLPNNVDYEFRQPPINAALQALLMKFISLFKSYGGKYISLYSHAKILTLIYSVLTLIIIYKILKEFDIPRIMKNFVLAVMAFYPGLIIMTTQYSNDPISYMFFYLSLLLAIKWCKNKKLSTIILLALSIGIGMLTKISVGLIAFIVGPMMFIIWIRSLIRAKSDTLETKSVRPSITLQLIIFALIVFPIGLSFSIRSKILFGVEFGEIFEIAGRTLMAMKYWNWSFADRFLSFPLSRIVETDISIYNSLPKSSLRLISTIW